MMQARLRKIDRNGSVIELSRYLRVGNDSSHIICKHQTSWRDMVIKSFYANVITCAKEQLPSLVPYDKNKVPEKIFWATFTPSLVCGEDQFAVGQFRDRNRFRNFQKVSQFLAIVDASVPQHDVLVVPKSPE